MNAEANTTATPQADNTRDTAGRFMPGNPGGPGNPYARQVAAVRLAMLEAVPPERMMRIVDKMAALAEAGNVQAAKLVFTFVVGKPQPAPNPDRMDADEWNVYRETVPMKPEAAAVISSGVPEQHLNYVRLCRPLISQMANEQAAQIFLQDPAELEAQKEREDDEMEAHLNSPVTGAVACGPGFRRLF